MQSLMSHFHSSIREPSVLLLLHRTIDEGGSRTGSFSATNSLDINCISYVDIQLLTQKVSCSGLFEPGGLQLPQISQAVVESMVNAKCDALR